MQKANLYFSAQPFSWTAGVLFLAAGAGLIFYFRYEKARMERKRVAEAAKGVGRPKVGGPFELLNHRGEKFSSEDMKGKYSLVCFPRFHFVLRKEVVRDTKEKYTHILDSYRSTSALPIAPTSVPKNSTKWPK